MEPNLRWLTRAVIAVAAFAFFVHLHGYALLDPDEARFARTSLEMMRSGDYVVPTFEGEPRLVKPPLLHWIQASIFRAVGPGEGIARLPAALATFGTFLLVGWVARRRFGEEGGIWAMAVFATLPLVFAIGRVGTLDALLSVHVFAAVALDLGTPDRPSGQRALAVGALLGLAFLVKGPVGVAVPVLAMLAGRTATGRAVWPTWRTLLFGIGALLAVVLPWGLAFVQRIGVDGVAKLLEEEIVRRSVEGTAHVEPAWFYAPVLVVASLPWTGPLLVGAFRTLARLRDPEAQTAVYATSALVAGLVLFSLSRGKLPNYVLPLMPFAALVATWEIGQELAYPSKRRLGASLVVVAEVALAVGFGGVAALGREPDARATVVLAAAAFGVAALVGLVALLRARPRWVFGAAAAATALFLVAAVFGAGGVLSERRSARGLVRAFPVLEDRSRPLVLAGLRVPSLTWYADRVPEILPSAAGVPERVARGDRPVLVVAEVDLTAIPESVRRDLVEIGRWGKFRILEPRPVESEPKAPEPALDPADAPG